MMEARTLDVSHLPPFEISNRAPLWWGQLIMCFIEGSLFLMLIAMYFYLRLGVDVWPPPGIKMPSHLMPTLALVPFIASGLGSYIASEGAKTGERSKMLLGLGLNLVLAMVFLIFRAYAWADLNFTWNSDAYGSIVWSILFLHTYDVVADVLMTTVLFIIIASKRYGEKARLGVHVDSVLWYFLIIIWIPLYGAVYWGPNMVGAR